MYSFKKRNPVQINSIFNSTLMDLYKRPRMTAKLEKAGVRLNCQQFGTLTTGKAVFLSMLTLLCSTLSNISRRF